MRLSFALVVVLVPSVALGQPNARKETVMWVLAQEAPTGGFYAVPPDPKGDTKPVPGLRATSAAVRTLKYLGAEIPNKDKHAAFVLSCFDPKTGGFAEPGGKPDVTITSVGVMAAAELGIPKEKYAKAMDYLKENAKTFEDVRIGAAAVEAWGVKNCPFDLKPWLKTASEHMQPLMKENPVSISKYAREFGSFLALDARLHPAAKPDESLQRLAAVTIVPGQRENGGWGRQDEKAGDMETTYRVMRALMLLKEKPKDGKKLREFIASHRNADGGYSTSPGGTSNVGGTYYATIITKWLDEMEAKK